MSPFPIWKAVHVQTGDDPQPILTSLQAGVGSVSVVLLDTKTDVMGGSGQVFDWEIAARLGQDQPIIVAGGLTPDNVALAVKQATPFALDVSSGVESTPGTKDLNKIQDFITKAKQLF